MTRSLTGGVTSIAVWSEPTDDPPFPATPARNPGESVFVGTSAGYLYAFAASDLSPIWNRSFGAGVTVRMASAPMNPPTNPSYSPALTEDGQRLFVNAGDWQSFYSLNGTLAWTGFPVRTPWTSPPAPPTSRGRPPQPLDSIRPWRSGPSPSWRPCPSKIVGRSRLRSSTQPRST